MIQFLLAVALLSLVGCKTGVKNDHSAAIERDNAATAGGSSVQLVFSTYFGGVIPCKSCSNALTFGQNTATDALGNIYVTGATQVSDLPVKNAFQPQPAANSAQSAFVAKFGPAGELLWSTYLGGDQWTIGTGVAVMPNGGVAVTGQTSSDAQGPFPLMNAFQPQNNGQSDAFVSVFDANGQLKYSTYLGGSGIEGAPGAVFVDDSNNGNGIAVDARGVVYVTGATSPDSAGAAAIKFPVTSNAIQPVLNGSGDATTSDAFICIIDPSKSKSDSLVYCSFLGGLSNDKGHSVAVNASGNQITVAGYTRSANFPTTSNAYRSSPATKGYTSNGFVTQFTSSLPGTRLSRYKVRYSTYLGSVSKTARDDIYAITLDGNGLIAATGRTMSADFPINPNSHSMFNSAPYLIQATSGDQPFLVKIDPSRSGAASLAYSSFLGGGSPGAGGSFDTAVAIDLNGATYLGGETRSLGILYTPSQTPTDSPRLFPYTANAITPSFQGGMDVALMKVSADGSTLNYSSYFGGTDIDKTNGIAVDPSGFVILSGNTYSTDFPLLHPIQTYPGNTGNENAFIAKFSVSCSYNILPKSHTFGHLGGKATVVTTMQGSTPCAPPAIAKDAEWIDINSAFFPVRGLINVTAAPNHSSAPRSATVTLGGNSFAAIQQGVPCRVVLKPAAPVIHSKTGGIGSFEVAAIPSDCAWTASPDATYASWITVTAGAQGVGNGKVSYVIGANQTGRNRNGNIRVALSNKVGFKVFIVGQRNRS